MEINNKFNIGEKVFFLVDNDGPFRVCNAVINVITASLTKDSSWVYYTTDSGHYLPEEKVFSSKEALIATL